MHYVVFCTYKHQSNTSTHRSWTVLIQWDTNKTRQLINNTYFMAFTVYKRSSHLGVSRSLRSLRSVLIIRKTDVGGGLDLTSSNGTHQYICPKFISSFILMSQVANRTVKNGRPMEKEPSAWTSNNQWVEKVTLLGRINSWPNISPTNYINYIL